MGQKIFLFFVLLTLSTSNGFNHLTPWDKETVYMWKADVKAGTNLPAQFASQFTLEGKLHLQSSSNTTLVKITDLSYKLYNGRIDHFHEKETHDVPVPFEVQDLQNVFEIVYGPNGLAVGIVTEEKEKEFSRNMKKALASILQMDDSIVSGGHDHNYAFVKPEHSIYGHYDTDYNVFPYEDSIEVHKFHDMKSPSHLYQDMISNTEPIHCDAGYEYPVMHESMRKYWIVKMEGHNIVKQVVAVGAIFYYPFKAKSDSQFIVVNQTMNLLQTVPVQEKFHLKTRHYEDHLTFEAAEETSDGTIADLTGGRTVVDYDKMMVTVQHMMQDAHKYLQEDHIHAGEPDSKRGQLINRVQRLLQLFPEDKLQKLQKMLTGEVLNMFYHLLPLVGTKASTLYIKSLVVSKTLDDDVMVAMLQQLPQNVIKPTVEWVAQMEGLIHLDGSVNWKVKKVALLAFASIIHKSFKHQLHSDKKLDPYVVEKTYEKYVSGLISKLKSTQDYKVQMVYLLSLYNMKLPSTAKLMMPAITGQWWQNQHLRMLSIWAAQPSLQWDSNHHQVIEMLWPIYTNVKEVTELRMTAFTGMMWAQPTHSTLMNMLTYMLREPDEELYHYQYTFIRSMMESKDPCMGTSRMKMAQLFKLLPPPSHGLSTVELFDYEDPEFGFSQGILTGYMNTNVSQTFSLAVTSQEFSVNHQEYYLQLKIHGIQNEHINPSNFLNDVLKKKWPKITDNKDIHIELIIVHHDNVINSYYFDQHNMEELSFLLDFFTKDSQTLKKSMLHMSYKRYHRAMIPTDLGTPAVWEFFMPEVYENDVDIKKEVSNKIVKLHLDVRRLEWIHYRHGLTFYNPIADIWQGINRYHTYDTVWPIHLEMTFNPQQQSMQLSWTKDDDPKMDVFGMRSHVKQMVFVKEDHDKNVLVQSSPHSKHFQVVSHGSQFTNNYTLINDDDLTTGHKWYAGVYDTSMHVSNGSFYNSLHEIYMKNYKPETSPLVNHFAWYLNFERYLLLLPYPGVVGFLTRVEPSKEHDVNSIDLSLRINSETAKDSSFYYTPGSKWSTRATYAVKGKEKSLKTWDTNAIIDMNSGHTVMSLKVHMTRIVPGQNDYKICVDGIKKWSQGGVSGHLNLGMSQTPDGKCVKDDTVIDITMTGKQSLEQEEGRHKYGACQYNIPYFIPHYHTLQCLVAHTTVRNYVYNVKTKNIPTEFKKTIENWWDHLKGYYISYYNFEEEHDHDVEEHTIKIDVTYPMSEEEVDITIMTPQHKHELTGLPAHDLQWMGLEPDSTVHSQWFEWMHKMGWIDHCVVHHDRYTMNRTTVHQKVSEEWEMFAGNAEKNPETAVYVKKTGSDDIAVKVVEHGHVMEVMSKDDGPQIVLDGQSVSIEEERQDTWVHYHVFMQDEDRPVAVMFPQSGIHFEYDKHRVTIVLPKVEQKMYGQCYNY